MSYFSYVGKFFSNVRGFYNEINAATLTGAIDVIIVQQEDGTYVSSPFHVRFGKLGVLRSRQRKIDVEINGRSVDLPMKLGESGEAFFVMPVEDENEDVPSHLATSPMPSASDLMERGVSEMRKKYLVDSKYGRPEEVTETEEVESRRRKLKKRSLRKKFESNDKEGFQDSEVPSQVFEMDDLSTDEELACMDMQTLGNMGKSVEPPNVEENSLLRTSEWAYSQYNTSYGYLHPFSDTDISPVASPVNTRPPSPTKSDTEVEIKKSNPEQSFFSDEDNTRWEWGHLPQKAEKEIPSTLEDDKSTENAVVPLSDQEKSNDAVMKDTPGGLFQFMRKTKSVRHKPETEGIYLDDLNIEEMDPEVAKLYFPKNNINKKEKKSARFTQPPFVSIKDEDTESGRGASLPVSPHSVEGAIGGPPVSTVSFLDSEVKHLGKFSMSLCGGLSDPEGVTLDKFMQRVVTFEDLCENYTMINNPDLVIRIGESFFNWQTAAPLILANAVFNQPLPQVVQDAIIKENMPKKKEMKKGRVSSWFYWRKPVEATSKLESSAAMATSDTEISTAAKTQSDVSLSPPVSSPASIQGSPRKDINRVRKMTAESLKADDENSSSECDTESDKISRKVEEGKGQEKKNIKVLRLTSEQIKKMHLKDGMNEATFSVTTQYQGTTRCQSHIYLWHWNDKIVVSDIDGTITKSDVLGQILPIVGRDWSQSGVAQLYSNIAKNGYKFLYLSARAIGQSRVTKDLLKSIKQEFHVLPDGPLLLSPTSLISAFHKEVIEKRPQDFKISCLKDIASLFPNHVFYAGFGNKINDVYAYKALDIPPYRIFTINHRGELKQESAYTYMSSYMSLSDVADHFFPPLETKFEAPEYNAATYWREPIPSIHETDLSGFATEPDPRLASL